MLVLLKTVLSDQNLSIYLLRAIVLHLNALAELASHSAQPEIQEMSLSVIFNVLASIEKEMSESFLKSHIDITQLFLALIADHDETESLAIAALECLELILIIGGMGEEDTENGDKNPVVDYCLQHPLFDNLEQSQKSSSKDVKEMARKIINTFFT